MLYKSYTVWFFTRYILYFLEKINLKTSSDIGAVEIDLVSTDTNAPKRKGSLTVLP